MKERPLDLRRGVRVGVGVSVFFTVMNTLQAPADMRVANAVATPITCAIMLALVYVTATTLQSRRNR